jgi:hypothetical protein
MTIPRLMDMNKYWADNPPIHVIVASRLGINKKSPVEASGLDENGNSLFDLF